MVDQDQNDQIVGLDSVQFKQFVKKIEDNCKRSDCKLSACLLCWGFLSYFQKKRHQEHSHYIVTPVYFKSEKLFKELALKHGKLYEQQNQIAIFSDTVSLQQLGAYGQRVATGASVFTGSQ